MVKSSPGVSPKPRFGPNLDLTATKCRPLRSRSPGQRETGHTHTQYMCVCVCMCVYGLSCSQHTTWSYLPPTCCRPSEPIRPYIYVMYMYIYRVNPTDTRQGRRYAHTHTQNEQRRNDRSIFGVAVTAPKIVVALVLQHLGST